MEDTYNVVYLDKGTGNFVSVYNGTNKATALEKLEGLKALKYKEPHIQYTFEKGGVVQPFSIGYRPEFLETPIIYGREIEISMPNGEKRKAQFAIVEAENILASHNENNFADTVGYPTLNGENINDRNYKDDINAQGKVIEVAQNLDPNILISSSRTPAGTPIITKDGIVVSGNNRTMSIKLAIAQYPEQYQEYKKFLESESFVFGFDSYFFLQNGTSVITNKDNVTVRIINPILVRIDYDFPEYNTTELGKYNKDTKKSERPIDKAIKIGKMLKENEGCKNIISEIVGSYETFSELYANIKDQQKLRDTLVTCGIISSNELAQYFDERGFNESGKDLVENLLAGLILSKDALVAGSMAGGRKFKGTIITSLPVLTKNDSLGPVYSLIPIINQAFLLEKQMHDANLDFEYFLTQHSIFEEKPPAEVLIMNRLLAAGTRKFKSSMEGYNASAVDAEQESLFGDKPTQPEIFKTHITNKIDAKDLALIEKVSNKIENVSEKIEPIEELGTGANVYFKTPKYRVNDLKNGKITLNIESVKDGEPAIANETFETAQEAIDIAKKLDKLYPNGIPDEVNIIKLIDNIKKGEYDKLISEIAKKQIAAENVDVVRSTPTYKKLREDMLFIIGLQLAKENKKPTSWDINLFKSSFTNKIKNAGSDIANAILLDLQRLQKEKLKTPAFTQNHQIWQYLTDKPIAHEEENVIEPEKSNIIPLQKEEIKNLTLSEFSDAVYAGRYDFERLGMDRKKIQNTVANYHATTDIQNKELAKKEIDAAIKQEYTPIITMAWADEYYTKAILDKKMTAKRALEIVQSAGLYKNEPNVRKEIAPENKNTKLPASKLKTHEQIVEYLKSQGIDLRKSNEDELFEAIKKIPERLMPDIYFYYKPEGGRKGRIEKFVQTMILHEFKKVKPEEYYLLSNEFYNAGMWLKSAAVEATMLHGALTIPENQYKKPTAAEKQKSEIKEEPKMEEKKQPNRSEFIENLHPLDMWVKFADGRFYRKFQFKAADSAKIRGILDWGVKEDITDNEEGNMTATISVPDGATAEKVSEVYMDLFPHPEQIIKRNDSESTMVKTKDGVELKKRSNDHKGHIFYDEEGNGYECLGYFENLDECVYRDLKTGIEVTGCVDGFYFNNPILANIEKAAPAEIPAKTEANLLVNDNWYKLHPEKILGEPYEASGRFGKVTKYKGTIDAVNRIPAPMDFMELYKDENPTLSTQAESVEQLLIDPATAQNIETAIESTKKETILKTIKKHKKATDRVIARNAVIDADMFTFEEVFAANNPEISMEELRVFIWYKEQIGQPLSTRWYTLAGAKKKSNVIQIAPSKQYDVITANGKPATLIVGGDNDFKSFKIKFENSEYHIHSWEIYGYNTFEIMNDIWRTLKENDFNTIDDIENEFGIGYRGKVEREFHTASFEENTKFWVESGLLYYFRGQLLPSFLYFSGNIYEKKSALTFDEEKIVATYGQKVFDNQKLQLNNIFKISYDKRLTLTNAQVENRLKILPISKFAQTVKIKTLVDGKEFKMKSQPASGKQPGRPDFLHIGHISDWKKTKFEELSLAEAFQYWLVEYANEYEIKKSTTYFDIISIYINQRPRPKSENKKEDKEAEAIWQRKVNITKEEGDRLFGIFMAEWLENSDIVKIETLWNEKFNGYLPINYNKIPVAFSHAKEYKGQLIDIRPEKREAIAFSMNEGVQCIAYDVGVGKTFSALFTIKQFLDAGYCKRPMIVTPNQVYKQFIAEAKGLFPDVKFNELYNLSADYIEDLKGPTGNIEMVDEGSITVMTYEGFEMLGFNEQTADTLLWDLFDILDQRGNQEESKKSNKAKEKETAALLERMKMLIGRGLKGTRLNVEDLGFDFGCWDEAHKMKKLFVGVKGEVKNDGESREKSPYQISAGGAPSSIALKGFMISQYILKNNNNRNILTLTATPFTNSPLEIFSVLTFLASGKLEDAGLSNIKAFFDTYVQATNELTINAKLRPERKQVVLGFNNLVSLQQLIRRFVNYKTGESVRVKRPDKYVLPYKNKVIGGETIVLSPSERVECNLPMTSQQAAFMADIKLYAEGKVSLNAICSSNTISDKKNANPDDEDEMLDSTVGVELDEDSLDEKEKAGVRTLRAMAHARNLALSPYLYECSGLGTPTYKEYIETSPKLEYVMECIKSVKKHHEKAGTPISGQVIYMDRGVEYFNLIRQYLIKEVGFAEHEVGIIKSQMPGGKDAKEKIKNLFLGEKYNELTGEMEDMPDSERMKIVIGSSTIKEGINLQKHSTVLYNCFLDWNPTDIKQLEGRIWRQGNLFKSVRIVNPMMNDSLDIFIFEKLGQKTARIAEIWDSAGETNTFNLEEFNPQEIKASLISDPMVLAEMELMQDKEKMEDEIRGVENEIKTLDKITEAAETVNAYSDKLAEFVEEYRPSKEGQKRELNTLINLAKEVVKKQIGKDGLPMENSYNRKPGKQYSVQSPAYAPYYLDKLVLANRTLKKAEQDFLGPKKLMVADIPLYKESLNKKIEELKTIQKNTTSEESIKLRAEHIRIKRENEKEEIASVSQRVKAFETLNYLLDEKIIKSAKKPKETIVCPPIAGNSKEALAAFKSMYIDKTPTLWIDRTSKEKFELIQLRTDKDAVEHLMSCIAKLPQTKDLHTVDGEYTPERKKLHKRIIEKFTENLACIKQDKPIAILTGGAPGSGKSHFIKNFAPYLLSKDIFHVDADEVRAQIPEYEGWNSPASHLEAKDIVGEMINQIGGSCKFDIVYDGTMNKAKKYYEVINKLKGLGYDVFIIYIDVPEEISAKRVMERYQRAGRFVPWDVVQEVFDAGHTAFDQIKTMVTGWINVDGMTGEIIATGGDKIPQDRNYAQLTSTVNFHQQAETDNATKAKKLKIAKAKAAAQKQRIRILAMKTAEKGAKINKLQVINFGGDRYDGGVVYEIHENGVRIADGFIDGDWPIEYKGKEYDGLKALADGIGAELILAAACGAVVTNDHTPISENGENQTEISTRKKMNEWIKEFGRKETYNKIMLVLQGKNKYWIPGNVESNYLYDIKKEINPS